MIQKVDRPGKVPVIRRNVKEDLFERTYPNGQGVMVCNASLLTNEIKQMQSLYVEAFKKQGILLTVVESNYLLRYIGNSNHIASNSFCLFYDKDTVLAELLEEGGSKVYNSSKGIRLCDSKSFTHIALSKANVPTVETLVSPMLYDLGEHELFHFCSLCLDQAESRFGYPMVIKQDVGSLGKQVYLANNRDEAIRLLDAIGNKRVLFQPYIGYKKGTDLRIYLVGNHVVGAMERHNPNDFRSNIENGGVGIEVKPSQNAIEIAKKAAKALHLEFAGVDLLYVGEDEYLVNEVNSCPHFLGLLKYTGINFADHVAKHISKHLKHQ